MAETYRAFSRILDSYGKILYQLLVARTAYFGKKNVFSVVLGRLWGLTNPLFCTSLFRAVQEIELQRLAATTIQSFWRATRAVHLTKIQRAMFKVRQMQAGASKREHSENLNELYDTFCPGGS